MASEYLTSCKYGHKEIFQNLNRKKNQFSKIEKFVLRKLLSIADSGPETLIDCCSKSVSSDENCANGTQIFTKISFSEPVRKLQ